MEVTISAKKMNVGDAFYKYAGDKLSSRLDKFFVHGGGEAKVVIEPVHDKVMLELTVLHGGLFFRSQQSAERKEDALDAAVERIIRQIRKNKTKLSRHLRDTLFDAGLATADTTEDDVAEDTGSFNVVRSKSFNLRPMNVQEAILQMNLLSHRFFVFKNADTGGTAVVYARNNGEYGLIEDVK